MSEWSSYYRFTQVCFITILNNSWIHRKKVTTNKNHYDENKSSTDTQYEQYIDEKIIFLEKISFLQYVGITSILREVLMKKVPTAINYFQYLLKIKPRAGRYWRI